LHTHASQKIQEMNLQPILNENPPWTHIELEIDVLGLAKILVKHSLPPINMIS
jgi:hypothetical protein